MLAYFQIENNEKFPFFAYKNQDRKNLTKDDYIQAAKQLSKQVREYIVFIDKASGHRIDTVFDTVYPFISNCGFACELMLKSLLCYEQCDFGLILKGSERHSLLKLFDLLSDEIKTKITSHRFFTLRKNEDFYTNLKENAQAFTNLRYASDYKELVVDMYFLPNLMVILHNVLEEIEKENNS